MKDINKMILIGRLGADPIQRKTKTGTVVAHLSVATARRVMKENRQDTTEPLFMDETQWHQVVAWGRQAEVCVQYLKKGSLIYVEGFLKTRDYQDKKGENKLSVEVQAENISFLGGKIFPEKATVRPPASNLELSAAV